MGLEEYNVAIQDFHDSLRGLDAAIQEALGRCDTARLACGKVRLAYEDEQAQRASTRSRFPCPERETMEEQYLLAVIAYGDTLNSIQLRPRVVNDAERHRIERARNACNAAFKALQDHEGKHECTRAWSARRAANAGCCLAAPAPIRPGPKDLLALGQ
jgi:hypothetical protein